MRADRKMKMVSHFPSFPLWSAVFLFSVEGLGRDMNTELNSTFPSTLSQLLFFQGIWNGKDAGCWKLEREMAHEHARSLSNLIQIQMDFHHDYYHSLLSPSPIHPFPLNLKTSNNLNPDFLFYSSIIPSSPEETWKFWTSTLSHTHGGYFLFKS